MLISFLADLPDVEIPQGAQWACCHRSARCAAIAMAAQKADVDRLVGWVERKRTHQPRGGFRYAQPIRPYSTGQLYFSAGAGSAAYRINSGYCRAANTKVIGTKPNSLKLTQKSVDCVRQIASDRKSTRLNSSHT